MACCPDEPLEDAAVGSWSYETRRHFAQPEWWETARYAPERLRPLGAGGTRPATGSAHAASTAAAAGTSDARNRDLVTARAGEREDERAGRAAGEVSPHLEGRAQPGDVLGIETGGETTEIGDTSEDENERRRTAERTVRDRRD
jgi:hypothetical protein